MTQVPDPFEAMAGTVRFAVWSDNVLAADELSARIVALGQSALPVTSESEQRAECLVVLTHKPYLEPAELAICIRLANKAKVNIAARGGANDQSSAYSWPGDAVLTWSGRLPELGGLAKVLVELLPPDTQRFGGMLTLYPSEVPLPGLQVAETEQALVEMLVASTEQRIVPLSEALFDELAHRRAPATNRQQYDLFRLARWSSGRYRRAFVNPRVVRLNELTGPSQSARSLDDVCDDALTRRLVVLLGEPGAGKTVQLRYFDTQTALRSIRERDSRTASSFYVALSDQPAQPNISLNWLSQLWRRRVDEQRWCPFDRFLADDATILLDGLNEGGGGIRTLPPREWMMRWRDVMDELLDHGAARVIVACRTRDQLIPLRAPRGEGPTLLTVLPLSRQDVVAIASQRDPDVARRLDAAMTSDARLAELYSNPFRLRAFLGSGAPYIATTKASLFGFQISAALISAAILRERDQLNFHGDLIPERAAVLLANLHESRGGDPWPILSTIPLIQSLAALAKALTFPTEPDGGSRLTMSRHEAGAVLVDTLLEINRINADADFVLDTARDLHILAEDDANIRFIHPSLQHLFAASGSSVEEIVALARDERRLRDHHQANIQADALPRTVVAPSYADHRYEEVYQFAAQLGGVGVPDRLVQIDPVLAASAYLSIRPEPAAANDGIMVKLRGELDHVRDHGERSAILAALGDLGWRLPDPRDGGPRALTSVPAGEWRLGLHANDERAIRASASEFRVIELPPFRIRRFPVSNAEFRRFIDDDGYHEKSLWTPEGWEWRMRTRTVEQFVTDWGRRRDTLRRHPRRIVDLLRSGSATPAGAAALLRFANLSDADIAEFARRQQTRSAMVPKWWDQAEFANPLQPVVGVSWFEANAFCEWLGRQFGMTVRLASEDEWEAACVHSLDLRDTSDVADALANTVDHGYAATTPIGTFATQRQTEQDLPIELLGNVFEWVFDHYAPGEHNRRIMKGGSWRHEAWRAHPAYRGRGDVDTQNDDIGFRYVVGEGRS